MRAKAMAGWMVLATLMVLAPSSAMAQSEAYPEYENVGEEVYETPSSMTPLTASEGGGQYRDTGLMSVNGPRFVLASLGGAAGGALLGTAGFYGAAFAMCVPGSDLMCVLGALVLGGGIGAALGTLGGTLLVGSLMDGDGAWWGVLGGMAVGVTLGAVAGNFLPSEQSGVVFGATAAASVLLGSLGYELTSHHSAKYFRDHRYALAPTVLPGSRGTLGAGIALSGTWD